MSQPRRNPLVLRAVLANALILVGLYQVYKAGKLTPGFIALYVGIAIFVNGLLYFGARARKRLQDR